LVGLIGLVQGICCGGFVPLSATATATAAAPEPDAGSVAPAGATVSPEEVLSGLRRFFAATARPDGSFQPGIDPEYRGMSDSAYSDLAAVTYAATLHRTFGWKLPHEERTIEFLLGRQQPNGDFFNLAGTVDPRSPDGRTYNTTQGLVALTALGVKPKHDPLPVFEAILREDYKQLPAYSTSFFPLAYLCAGRAIPEKADRGIRALMIQDETGYTNDHVAATFHASHYYSLVGEATPRSKAMVARVLRDQNSNGSWLLNMPARDRHATFDAVFVLAHEAPDEPVAVAAIQRAVRWVLSCRNADGGFGHYPGSTSDADANYFHVGVLVMAGYLRPAKPLPPHPELLSWGHLMPVRKSRPLAARIAWEAPGWVASVAFSPGGDRLAVACADQTTRVIAVADGTEQQAFRGHADRVLAARFAPDGQQLATGSFDGGAALWDAATGRRLQRLSGHRGAVMAVAFTPTGDRVATAGFDGSVRLWDAQDGRPLATLSGHRSWVSALACHPRGEWLASGSSDGRVIVWSLADHRPLRTLDATNGEVRSLAVSSDGGLMAVGTRYGKVKLWSTADWRLTHELASQGDHCAVAFAPHGKRIAVTEGDWNRGGTVRIHSTADGRLLAKLPQTGETLALDFSPDGQRLAAGAADKTVRIWDLP
jgi:geranylgeranyl transferase type-2 subunit beta